MMGCGQENEKEGVRVGVKRGSTDHAPARRDGAVEAFNLVEHLPTLAQPAQDGATTTRRYLDWLSRRPDMPCFTWLQFFDTHPPALPPARYSRMYYQGDPSSPERRNRPDSLAAIHGVE